MKHTHRLMVQKAEFIFTKVNYTSKDKIRYAYLKLTPDEYRRLSEAQERGTTINIHEWGELLIQGYGKEPPQAVIDYLNRTYDLKLEAPDQDESETS